MKIKTRVAAFVAALLALGGVSVATAEIASAHNKSVAVTCSALSVELSSYPAHSTVKVTIDGATKVDQEFTAYSNSWSLDPLLVHPYIVKVVSSDGQHQFDIDTSGQTTPCKPDQQKVTLCHATSSTTHPYSLVDVAGSAVVKQNQLDLNGHGQHDGDIIPEFDYYLQDQGGNYVLHHYPGQNLGADTLSNGCVPPKVEVTPVNPTVVQSSACGEEGSFTIPDTTGVTYYINGVPIAAGKHSGPVDHAEISALADDGYKLTNPEWTFELNIDPAVDCLTQVKANVASGNEHCTEVGGISVGGFTVTGDEGVTFTLATNDGPVPVTGSTDAGPGTYVVTAHAPDGTTFGDSLEPGDRVATKTFTVVVNPPDRDCRVIVQPEPPTVNESVCTGPGTHSNPTVELAESAGIVYTYDSQSQVVTATPTEGHVIDVGDSGFVLNEDGTATYKVTFESPGNCLVDVTAAAPTFANPTCSSTSGSVTIPVSRGVSWTLVGTPANPGVYEIRNAGGATVTVAAHALAGYTLVGTTSWKHTFQAATGCPVPPPPNPPHHNNTVTCADLPPDQLTVDNGCLPHTGGDGVDQNATGRMALFGGGGTFALGLLALIGASWARRRNIARLMAASE